MKHGRPAITSRSMVPARERDGVVRRLSQDPWSSERIVHACLDADAARGVKQHLRVLTALRSGAAASRHGEAAVV